MKRLTITVSLSVVLLGCGQREQQAIVAVTPTVTMDDANTGLKSATNDAQISQSENSNAIASTDPPPGPTSFEYPPDLTGKAMVKAVAPETPALTPAERFGGAPKSRAVPTKIMNPEMMTKADHLPPPILTVRPISVSISPPQEKVPFDLGSGAGMVPAKPGLPIAAAITERARDVNLPPSMPILGRPVNERVSLDDPTSESANAAIVIPGVNVPLKSAEFVKVALPDPFELGEQVKPKVPPAAEPGLNAVPIDPQRVK